MNTQQRLTLSNSIFEGRIKKFDTYRHDPRTSVRTSEKVVGIQYSKPRNTTIIKPVPVHEMPLSTHLQKPVKVYNYSNSRELSNSLNNLPENQSIGNDLSGIDVSAESDTDFIDNQFAPPTKQNASILSRLAAVKKSHALFYGLGISVFIFSAFVSVQTLLFNKQTKEDLGVLGAVTQTLDDQGVVEGVEGSPAEDEISNQAKASYAVDLEAPRYLRIPDIGVYARIKQTGVTRDGAVATPTNINDVSWYKESAKPGNEIGSSLLLGHVSGWTAPGVFKKLDKLQPGTRLEVEKGSGEKLVYEVVRTEKIPVEQIDMSKILAPETVGEHDLKLITCGGKYNRETDHYEDRVIVYAKILR